MKRKIFMPMAAALTMAVGISTTAMAANVTTETNYTYGNDDFEVTVTTYVTTTAGEEVTFLVAKDAGVEDGTDIVYIDQQTATADTNLDFTFKAAQSKLYNDTIVSAKFGTDGTDKDFGTFKFNDAVDYFTNSAVKVETSDVTLDTGYNDGLTAVAKFVGNVSEYGFELLKDNELQGDLKAYASANGVYAVQVTDLGEGNWSLKPYVIDAANSEKVYVK